MAKKSVYEYMKSVYEYMKSPREGEFFGYAETKDMGFVKPLIREAIVEDKGKVLEVRRDGKNAVAVRGLYDKKKRKFYWWVSYYIMHEEFRDRMRLRAEDTDPFLWLVAVPDEFAVGSAFDVAAAKWIEKQTRTNPMEKLKPAIRTLRKDGVIYGYEAAIFAGEKMVEQAEFIAQTPKAVKAALYSAQKWAVAAVGKHDNPLSRKEAATIRKVAAEHSKDAREHKSCALRHFDAGTAAGLSEALAITRKNPKEKMSLTTNIGRGFVDTYYDSHYNEWQTTFTLGFDTRLMGSSKTAAQASVTHEGVVAHMRKYLTRPNAEMSSRKAPAMLKILIERLTARAVWDSKADYHLTLLKGINPARASVSDIDTINDLAEQYGLRGNPLTRAEAARVMRSAKSDIHFSKRVTAKGLPAYGQRMFGMGLGKASVAVKFGPAKSKGMLDLYATGGALKNPLSRNDVATIRSRAAASLKAARKAKVKGDYELAAYLRGKAITGKEIAETYRQTSEKFLEKFRGSGQYSAEEERVMKDRHYRQFLKRRNPTDPNSREVLRNHIQRLYHMIHGGAVVNPAPLVKQMLLLTRKYRNLYGGFEYNGKTWRDSRVNTRLKAGEFKQPPFGTIEWQKWMMDKIANKIADRQALAPHEIAFLDTQEEHERRQFGRSGLTGWRNRFKDVQMAEILAKGIRPPRRYHRTNPHNPVAGLTLIGEHAKAVEYEDINKAKAEGLKNPATPWRHDYKMKGVKVYGHPDKRMVTLYHPSKKIWDYR